MRFATITKLALTRILATRTRSFLTMLGVIIGVASLVALTSIVSGATSGISGSLSSLGGQQVTVSGDTARALTEADAGAVSRLDGVEVVSTQVSGRGTAAVGAHEVTLSLTGVSAGYQRTADPEVAIGSFLPSFAGSEGLRYVVLSAQTADDLDLSATDVGGPISIDGQAFTLAGVLDDAGGFGSTGTAYLPLEVARGLFAQAPYVSTITVQAASADDVDAVQAAVDSTLRKRYGLGADDDARFSVSNQASLLSALDDVTGTLSLLLGGIASISLVVGGIGIMNIMLVSVRERTREIGVRRAIGARRSQILAQFVIEAVVLSILGGVLGLAVGLGVSAVIAQIAGWAFTVSGTTVGVALGFSALVGVVFGVWPARTASRLQPVDALRFE